MKEQFKALNLESDFGAWIWRGLLLSSDLGQLISSVFSFVKWRTFVNFKGVILNLKQFFMD